MPRRMTAALFLASAFAVASAPAAAAPLPAPLVVITGGYDSCADDGSGGVSPFGGNLNSEGVRFVNDMHPHVNNGIRWLFSCFTKTSELFYQANTDGGVRGGGAWDLSPLLDRIDALSDDYRRPIFIIGHSHGGWLAMRLAEQLRKPIVAGYLTTIDPISFVECNASTYADAILGWPTSAWDRIAPCRRAPGDFTAGDIARIRTKLNGNPWKHYWQQHFVPLHSGEIPGGPDFSLDMSPFFSLTSGGAASSWSAHTRISYLSSIWHALRVSFLNVYESR